MHCADSSASLLIRWDNFLKVSYTKVETTYAKFNELDFVLKNRLLDMLDRALFLPVCAAKATRSLWGRSGSALKVWP
jgi:hypothetical protein